MSNLDLFRCRLGRFRISIDIIEQFPEDALKILKDIIPIRAEYMYDSHCIEYTALSKKFEIVKDGLKCPMYLATINKEETTWKWIHE